MPLSGTSNSSPKPIPGGTGPGSTSTPGDTSGAGGIPGSPNPSPKATHGLSGGAIAGIVIPLLLILLALLVFVLRRRSRARRNARAETWWFTKKRNSRTYGDKRDSGEVLRAGTVTARSSFATTFDQGTPRVISTLMPSLPPPMAELGRADGRAPTLLTINTSHIPPETDFDAQQRLSVGSGHSGSSQYLVVHHRDSMQTETGTPMSVRPFSPTEAFSFPKPPDASERNSTYSRPTSGYSNVTFKQFPFPKSLDASERNSAYSSPTSGHSNAIVKQFTPPAPAPPLDFALLAGISRPASDPFADENPFEDPDLTTSAAVPVGEFEEYETIRRHFNPTLVDELEVKPGDRVRILQTFDDGWAMAKRQPLFISGQQIGVPEMGLIPIDCLREPGQDLQSFVAEKRVSNYADSSI